MHSCPNHAIRFHAHRHQTHELHAQNQENLYTFHLNQHKNCIVQLGGSDQWGNIVTGTELIRRKGGQPAFAVTTPLIKKADGSKFGKTESGNIWLDPKKTSPYAFYQYWLNTSDEDAASFIKIFTLFSKEDIDALQAEHLQAPHLRLLQKRLAEDITERVHGLKALRKVISASKILFGKSTKEDIMSLSDEDFLAVFDGVPQAVISRADLDQEISIIDALVSKSGFLKSNGEARRELKGNSISVNKERVTDVFQLSKANLINDKYILLGKGKKTNFVLRIEG